MCGIAGKFNFNNQPISEAEILAMNKEIEHRGPDDRGIYVDGAIGLGHMRLSIIDLSANGHQPMADSNKKYWITFNGEIYNFPDLKKELLQDGVKFQSNSDTEVIIYLYIKYGVDCLKYLRGMFAFAIWDKEKQELFLARDRVGKKPLKYYHDNNTFIFASELKSIFRNTEVKKEIDWSAIDEYLTFKYVPAPKTGFKNIFKLLPAHYMIIKANGEKTIKKYWSLDYSKKLDLSENEWQDKIEKKLIESVKIRMISDVPLGAHLSGGIDSSLIVAILAGLNRKPIRTFTIGFKEDKYNEIPYARLVAKKYKTNYKELIVEPYTAEILPQLAYFYEEPYADASALPSWYLANFTKAHVSTVLNGDGGDENFAGYERYRAASYYRLLKYLPLKKYGARLNAYLYECKNNKIFYKISRQLNADYNTFYDFYLSVIRYFSPSEKDLIYGNGIKTIIKNENELTQNKNNQLINQGSDWLDSLLALGINTHLPDDLLVKNDIASMAHGLELRSPFLDHEFMELSASMPARLKMNGNDKKYILKKIAENYLPHKCIHRPKQGFSVPLEFWFRGELSDYLEKNILSANFINRGFDKNAITKMLSLHKSKKANYENQLYALLMLSLWFEEWF